METFRDLFLRGDAAQLEDTLAEIDGALPEGWLRDTDAEGRMRAMALSETPVFCFCTPGGGRLPAAAITLHEESPGTYHVSNIVPRQAGRLTHGEYNAVIESFFEHVVRPAAAKHGARAELTSDQEDLETYLSAPAAKRLRSFSTLANKSTGSSHPLDRGRWFGFLAAAHRERSTLDSTTLARWLAEVEGWPAATAHELAAEYEFARGLLAAHDDEGQGAD